MSRVEIRGSPNRGLYLATWGFFVGFAAVALYGSTSKVLSAQYHLSPYIVGWLVAMPQLMGSLMRIPFAAWVDSVGGRPAITTLLGVSIAGMAGLIATLALKPPFAAALVFLFGALAGFGVATFAPGIAQVSYWFPQKRQGYALGFFGGVGNTAPGIFTLIVPFAVAAWGLLYAYAAWFIFLVIGTAIYVVFAVDAPYFQFIKAGVRPEEARALASKRGQELFPSGALTKALRLAALKIRTWALVALYFVSFGGFLTLTTWLPYYYSSFLGLSPTYAGVVTALGFTLPAALLRVLGGWLSDRIGGETTALMAYALVVVGAAVFMAAWSLPVAAAAAFIIALGMGVANAAVFKMVPKYVPEAVGGASGWVGGIGAFGGFAIPPVLGYFASTFGVPGYPLGYSIYVALGAAALAIVYALMRASKRP
ncbi:MAG: nitrate/nitrite transporter [Thermoproteus sp. AZ2]|jgi:NNP family nitrate/nitrite transporter-like MFS transporter|uniref:Nitrate/nitrite transporter n=1 Tax=Thermoproteus sp. AZ2 TaxID=1609232 RepID=A0ACC6V1X8_9CREN